MLSLRSVPVKNMKAHPARTLILMLLTLAQAACLFFGLMAVQGMHRQLRQSEARLGADLLVYPTAAVSKINMRTLLMQGTPVEVYRSRSMLERMDSCDGIAAVTYQLYFSDLTPEGETRWIVGFEPETDFVLSPWVSGGSLSTLPSGAVAVGSAVAVSPENTVTVYGKEWPVAARLETTGSLLDDAVFSPLSTLSSLLLAAGEAGVDRYDSVRPNSQFSAALVRVENREKLESVTNWINIYVRKVTAVRSEETLIDAASGIHGLTGILPPVAVGVWLVLLISLGLVQAMLMKERRKEYFVWNSIGASRKLIRGVIIKEAVLTHLLGAVLGVLASAAAFGWFGSGWLAGLTFSAVNWLKSAAASILATVLAGSLAAAFFIEKAMKDTAGKSTLTL